MGSLEVTSGLYLNQITLGKPDIDTHGTVSVREFKILRVVIPYEWAKNNHRLHRINLQVCQGTPPY
jgi:hypothetical protein